MIPRDTIYRLARTPQDYRRAHRLLADETAVLRFPTVLAERNGRVIGVISTQKSKVQAIVCGPLAVAKDIRPPVFVAVRLIEVYEALLQKAGVTLYLFAVEAGNHRWIDLLRECANLGPIERAGEYLWYQRTLPRETT